MTGLRDDEREALAKAIRSCRIEDAPVRVIREDDFDHVMYMISQAVEAILAARAAQTDAATALDELAHRLRYRSCPCGLEARAYAAELRAALTSEPQP